MTAQRPTAAPAAGDVPTSAPRLLALLALPAAAAALGGAVIGLQYLGVGHRPLPSTLILLAGIAAGVAPLRFGLPLAAGLACFQTTIDDFFGPPGRYWKEAFVAILVLRVLRRRWLRPGEAAVAAVVALVYIAYLATGTSLLAVGWAAKILFFALVAGWALVRLGAGRAEWTATYYALVVAAGANVVLGVWQRIEGWHGLLRLGLPYGERVRQAPTGAVRAFGGLTTAAPFAYVLALVVLAWVAFLVAEPGGRRLALNTIWVPPVALAGIALSLDRIALVGLTATILLGSLFRFRRRPALALIALAPVVVGLVLVLAGPSSRSFLLEGFTFSSHSAKARRLLWSEYADELNILGRGPASAGAAYERSLRNTPVTQFARGWYAFERDPSGGRFRWMTTHGGLLVGVPGRARRRALLTLVVASTSVDRTLTVSYGRLVLAHQLISTTENTTVPAVVPSGRGRALVQLATQPPAFRSGAESPHDKRRLSIRLDSLSASDAGPPDRTAAIYARVRQRAGVEALQGTAPGVVDNLYLSWLFQYGYLLGGALCVIWVCALIWPTVRRRRDGDALAVAMRLWGLFLLVGALVVNIWEESPIDFLVAIGFACLYGAARTKAGSVAPRYARSRPGGSSPGLVMKHSNSTTRTPPSETSGKSPDNSKPVASS